MRRALWPIVILSLFLLHSLKLSADPFPDLGRQLDALLADTTVRPFNGVVLISQGPKTLYSKASGFSNIETRRPIQLSDLFRIQSNSKQITAVLILKQVEMGEVDLEAPISAYLPELKQPWAKSVSVHQLLNMTSGIKSLDEELLFPPGTDFFYSNPGYGILGAILRKVTGQSYLTLADQLFAELGMKHTHSFKFDGESDVIDGYVDFGDGLKRLDFSEINFTEESWGRFAPAGGIISNAEDLLLWDTKLHAGDLLSEAMYRKLTGYSITAQHAAFGSDIVGYGYGVRVDNLSAKMHIGHAGRGIGFASIKLYFPDDDISLIVLENVYIGGPSRDPKIIYHFEREIRKLVLNAVSK